MKRLVCSALLSSIICSSAFEIGGIRSQLSQSVQSLKETALVNFDSMDIKSSLMKLSNSPLLHPEYNTDIAAFLNNVKGYVSTIQNSADLEFAKHMAQLSEITGIEVSSEVSMAIVLQGFAILFLFIFGGTVFGNISDELPYDVGTSTYNVQKADQFYRERPLLVAQRLLRLTFLTSSFNIKLLLDWRLGKYHCPSSRTTITYYFQYFWYVCMKTFI